MFIIWLPPLLLLAVLTWCVYWHLKENKNLTKHWQDTHEESEVHALSRFAWGRSFQLFGAVGALLVAVLLYGWKIDTLNEQLEAIQTAPQLVPPPPETLTQAPPERKPLPSGYLIQPIHPPVVDVFTPSASASDNSSLIDNLKQQYENTIVLYFIMTRCQFTLSNDYEWIVAALRQDMKRASAPAELQEQIIIAARGSYQELYAYSKCDNPEIQQLASQFRAYINALYQLKFN